MRLPVPLEHGGKMYVEAEIRRPTGGVIADTRKVADGGDIYAAMATFVGGCLVSLDDEVDRKQLKYLARELPYVDAEYLAIQAMISIGIADDIEGYYACPRCGKKILVDAGGEDRISELDVKFTDEPLAVDIAVDPPVRITNAATEEELVCVEAIRVGVPSLNQLSRAFKKRGTIDQVRMQFEAYVDATQTVNGAPIDGKWRATWGMMVFDRMDVMVVNKITRGLTEYGMASTISRTCLGCGKRWDAEVDTAGFFASGLAGN